MPDDAPAPTPDLPADGVCDEGTGDAVFDDADERALEIAGEDAIEGAGGVVIRNDGQVLVLRRANGAWVFPKGHLDPGEDHLTAALREVEEEAGVRATCPDPSRTWTTRYRNDRGVARRVTWFRLACPAGTEPELREALFPDGAFLPPDQAHERLSHEEDRELLRRVRSER
ncbi:MAG: NUDIX domain-containing protein [Trueperaceae bacterium]